MNTYLDLHMCILLQFLHAHIQAFIDSSYRLCWTK